MTNDYFHRASVGDEAECERISRSLAPALDGFADSDTIQGFWLAFVEDEDDASAKLIPDECLEITAGRYPFLYLRVNFPPDRTPDAAVVAMVTDAGFELLFEGDPSDDDE